MKKFLTGAIVLLAFMAVAAGWIMAARGTPKEREAMYLTRGNSLFAQGAYEKAALEYKNAQRLMPNDAEADYRLGMVYEALGDINNAFAGFNMAEQQNAHFRPALVKLAGYYIAGKQYEQAQVRINRVLADFPNDPEAHALQASVLLRRGDLAGAQNQARAALQSDPANLTAFSVISGVYVAQNNEVGAIAAVDEGIARNPKALSLQLLKAEIYENSGNLPGLRDTYHAIFALCPQEGHYRIHLADILLAAQKPEDAETVLREGIGALPRDVNMKHRLVTVIADHEGMSAAENEIRKYRASEEETDEMNFWLADLYFTHDNADRAAFLLQEMISKDRTDVQRIDARVLLARIELLKGDRRTAEKLVRLVLDLQPRNAGALLVRAKLEYGDGRLQDAVSDLRMLLQIEPKNGDGLQILGEVFLRQGHTDLAIDTLTQLTESDPVNWSAKVRLAQMYMLANDGKQAEELLTQTTKSAPQYAPGWESLIRLLIGRNDIQNAQAALDTLARLQGQKALSVFLEGMLQEKNAEPEEAIAYYKQAIAADPSTPTAEYALQALVQAEQKQGALADAIRYIEQLPVKTAYTDEKLGEGYTMLGQENQAGAAFEKAIEAHPSSQTPYLERAKLYFRRHQDDKALALLGSAASVVPGDTRAPMMQAHIFTRSGNFKEAAAIYTFLLNRNPQFDVAANNLAALIADYNYTDAEELEKGRLLAERFLLSRNPMFLDTLGWIYYRQGNVTKAVSLTVRGIEINGNPAPQLHYHYGAIFLKAGRIAEAKAELQQAVNTGDVAYFGLAEAQSMLKGLSQ